MSLSVSMLHTKMQIEAEDFIYFFCFTFFTFTLYSYATLLDEALKLKFVVF